MNEKSKQQFQEQGGAATMDPNIILRWLTSKMMSRMSSEALNLKHAQGRKKRKKSGLPHTIEYFHHADDGYSHLAVQLLSKMQARYKVELHCHLVSESTGANLPEPELLSKLSCYDANQIAPYYGLEPTGADGVVAPELVTQAVSILAGLSNEDFIQQGAAVSSAMWGSDEQH